MRYIFFIHLTNLSAKHLGPVDGIPDSYLGGPDRPD
jgi:hypothetical protein